MLNDSSNPFSLQCILLQKRANSEIYMKQMLLMFNKGTDSCTLSFSRLSAAVRQIFELFSGEIIEVRHTRRVPFTIVLY